MDQDSPGFARQLDREIATALSKKHTDSTRYAPIGQLLEEALGLPPDSVRVKASGNVGSVLKTRLGEAKGWGADFEVLFLLLTRSHPAVLKEIEKATAFVAAQADAGDWSQVVALTTPAEQGQGWVVARVLAPPGAEAVLSQLRDRFPLAETVGLRLPASFSESPSKLDRGSEPSDSPYARTWLEMTKSEHNHGGQGWEFGTCLWSPTADTLDRDRYGVMREPMPGDRVFHCLDSEVIGTSVVAESWIEVLDEPPKAGPWASRDSYFRIDLEEFSEAPIRVDVAQVLEEHEGEIRADLTDNRPPHYPFYEEKSGGLRSVQGGYLTRLTPLLEEILVGEMGLAARQQPTYNIAQCALDLGIDEDRVRSWIRAIERKGQVIIYGPPGTGKTYVAEHLARHLISGGDGFVDMVQFHPAYEYEDFVQGIRPVSEDDGISYRTVPGRLLEFCARAAKRSGRCVLLIDEINRANLSRVFGELFYLMEYRRRTVRLAGGGELRIPDNVRIVGTMNTADRSIALVDHALRRRFAFVALWPEYSVLKYYHSSNNTGFDPERLIEVLQKVNGQIDDRHYEVGVTYFLRDDILEQLPDIWTMEIEPYLEEYFFNRPESVSALRWNKVRELIEPYGSTPQ